MKGYPKHINDKADIYNLLETDYAPPAKADLLRMLDDRQDWVLVGKLDDGEDGVTDETHEVRKITDDDGTVIERYQYEFTDDPGCELFRIGFTVEEAEEVLNG